MAKPQPSALALGLNTKNQKAPAGANQKDYLQFTGYGGILLSRTYGTVIIWGMINHGFPSFIFYFLAQIAK
jgi:hypothetical protein